VVKPQRYEQLAATELVDYLERITGKRLDQIETDDQRVAEGIIAVGTLATKAGLITTEELKPLARDGYVARVGDGRGAVCGFRDVGTIYGAYAMLEYLGVRFFAPDCEVVPKRSDLVMPEGALRVRPHFGLRIWGDLRRYRNREVSLKLGQSMNDEMGNPAEIGEPGGWSHSSAFLVPYRKYYDAHPEYFALEKDGQRLKRRPGEPFDVHLCLSNPEVRRIAAERLLMLIGKQPDRYCFTVSQGDGYAWCQCEKCKALDADPGVDMTDRLLDFVNELARAVARRYPDKRIVTLAYTGATARPPTRVVPEPNVLIAYCVYPPRARCQSHDLTCEKNWPAQEDLEGWSRRFPRQVFVYEYPMSYGLYYEPFGSFYAMKRKMERYAALGVEGIGYCHAPASFLDLFLYVQSKLAWNPRAAVEAMIDEFMAAYYGPAAHPMREYFDFMHREIDERPVHQNCESGRGTLVTPEFAAKALEILSRAQASAADNPAFLGRIEAEKFCVLYSDLQHHNPRRNTLAVDKTVFVRRLSEMVRIARSNKVELVGRGEPGRMGNWLTSVCAAKLTVDPWYDDPWIERLIADPENLLCP
jgi:hypothetical protein